MLMRPVLAIAMLVLTSGNAVAGRACPSDVATGSSVVSEKSSHPAHATSIAHGTDAATAIPALAPAHGTMSPGCCSMPFTTAGDVIPAAGVGASNRAPSAESVTLAPASHTAKPAPAKSAPRQPQRSAVAPAFGPLFLAHQALML